MPVDKAGIKVAVKFGENLNDLRRRAGFTQGGLALRTGLDRTEIGLLENGKRMPRLDTIIRLAGALEKRPSRLLDGMAWVPEPGDSGRFNVRGHVA